MKWVEAKGSQARRKSQGRGGEEGLTEAVRVLQRSGEEGEMRPEREEGPDLAGLCRICWEFCLSLEDTENLVLGMGLRERAVIQFLC